MLALDAAQVFSGRVARVVTYSLVCGAARRRAAAAASPRRSAAIRSGPPALLPISLMAAHESPRRTKLFERTKERLTRDEVERIRLCKRVFERSPHVHAGTADLSRKKR